MNVECHTDQEHPELSFAEFRATLLASLPMLLRFARGYCKTVDDAEDAVQATCEHALTRWHQWSGKGSLEHWLIKILVNAWRDETRSRKIRAGLPLDSVPEPKSDLSDPADIFYLEQVLDGVQHLPEGQRDVLSLVACEGLSYQEAADQLDIPVGTVMSRVSRGRRMIVQQFTGSGMNAESPRTH